MSLLFLVSFMSLKSQEYHSYCSLILREKSTLECGLNYDETSNTNDENSNTGTNSLCLTHYQQRLLEIQDYVSPGLIDVACALCGSFDEHGDSNEKGDFRVHFFAPDAVLITPNGPRLVFKNGIDLEYTDKSMCVSLLQCFLSSSMDDAAALSSDLKVHVTFATLNTPTNVAVSIKGGIQWKNVSKAAYEQIVRFVYHNVLEDTVEHKVPAPLHVSSLSRPSYVVFERTCLRIGLWRRVGLVSVYGVA